MTSRRQLLFSALTAIGLTLVLAVAVHAVAAERPVAHHRDARARLPRHVARAAVQLLVGVRQLEPRVAVVVEGQRFGAHGDP